MVGNNRKNPTPLAQAVEAIDRLMQKGLSDIFLGGHSAALAAHTDIEVTPVSQKAGVFFNRHFLSLVKELVAVFVESYRLYFKLALAHPGQVGGDSDKWAWNQLRLALDATFDWIRDWYILACDGENQYVRRVGSAGFVEGKTVTLTISPTVQPSLPQESWRAPAWLFQIGPQVGVGRLKEKHVPATDSEENLDAAHTRLLLKGARRVFLMALGPAIEHARNEETAAAGAVPAGTVNALARGPNKRTGWEQREQLYRVIREVLARHPELEGIEFCAELDKRHAPPLYDWKKNGEWLGFFTWKQAWGVLSLRRKIRRVRQEAMKNR